MADIMPLDPSAVPAVPSMEDNQGDALGVRSAEEMARETAEFHRIGLRSKKYRDLTAEKYALHIDGEGDAQWADILDGSRVAVPVPLMGAPREQNNQLRPIVDNYVAHLTTQRFSLIAEAKPSREAREKALVDSAIANHFARKQRWNTLFASAKYIAAAYGFCPIHGQWREDMTADPYEAVMARDQYGNPMIGPKRGTVDHWVGDPFGMVFDNAATRTRIHRTVYERVLPAELTRQAFGIPNLEGTFRMPSASIFHRIAAKWTGNGLGIHGRADLVSAGNASHSELIALLYDEIPPGILPDFPDGRLCIVALEGQAGADRANHRDSGAGNARLLWCGGLPGGRFSFTRVYSHGGRLDDPYGKPFVSDLDDDQMKLNQAETLHTEYLRRATKAPLITTGKLKVKTLELSGDSLFEIEPLGAGRTEGQWLEQPSRHIPALENKINRILEGMYRKGGWQSASRGDLPSGTSGKAIISAQQADDSIFGPQTEQTREEVQDLADLTWHLFKEFGDVPHTIDLVGDDLAHVAESAVDRTMLSDEAPQFTLVSGFGVTPEADAQQILSLLDARDFRGEGVITASQVREMWPDRRLFQDREDPQRTRERRPRVINAMLRDAASQLIQQIEQQGGQVVDSMGHPSTIQAGRFVAMMVDDREPALMDDDLEAHIDTLSLIVQDSSEHAVTRRAAEMRQQQYWQWLAQKQMAATAAAQPAAGGAGGPPQEQGSADARQGQLPQPEGGTVNSEAMVRADQKASAAARNTP